MAMLRVAGGILHYLDGTEVMLDDLMDGSVVPLPMLGGHPEAVRRMRVHIRFHSPFTGSKEPEYFHG